MIQKFKRWAQSNNAIFLVTKKKESRIMRTICMDNSSNGQLCIRWEKINVNINGNNIVLKIVLNLLLKL